MSDGTDRRSAGRLGARGSRGTLALSHAVRGLQHACHGGGHDLGWGLGVER